MKNLCSIGTIAIGSIALNLLPVNPGRAASLASGSANLSFTPTTPTTTTIRWGADNPNTTLTANGGAGNGSAANQTAITGWTSEGYNFLVPSGTAVNTPGTFTVGAGTATPKTDSVKWYGSNLDAPNNAGYYIAADSAYQTGRIYQDLTNLTVGQQYLVKFYQAAAQQNGFVWDPAANNGAGAPSTTTKYFGATTDNWIVNVGATNYTPPTYTNSPNWNATAIDLTGSFTGGTTYVSPTMSLANQAAAGAQTYANGNGTIINGTGTTYAPTTVNTGNSTVAAIPGTNVAGSASAPVGWQQDSFAFTATNTTQRLSFMSQGTPAGQPPFALLAGVSVEQLPEPEGYVGTLLGIGVVGWAIRSRLKQQQKFEK